MISLKYRMKINYEPLKQELQNLNNIIDTKDIKDSYIEMMKHEDICSVLDGSLEELQIIAEHCKTLNANKIYDIGCASGYLSEVFKQMGLQYVGIEGYFHGINYWNSDIFDYIEKPYPFRIDTNENDIAISRLCIGWNCFKTNEDTFDEQAKALARDFKKVILYCQDDFISLVKQYFKKCTKICVDKSSWYLLENE